MSLFFPGSRQHTHTTYINPGQLGVAYVLTAFSAPAGKRGSRKMGIPSLSHVLGDDQCGSSWKFMFWVCFRFLGRSLGWDLFYVAESLPRRVEPERALS